MHKTDHDGRQQLLEAQYELRIAVAALKIAAHETYVDNIGDRLYTRGALASQRALIDIRESWV